MQDLFFIFMLVTVDGEITLVISGNEAVINKKEKSVILPFPLAYLKC